MLAAVAAVAVVGKGAVRLAVAMVVRAVLPQGEARRTALEAAAAAVVLVATVVTEL